MKFLKDILHNITPLELEGNLERPIRSIVLDSRKINKDDLFVAISGTSNDGHEYIQQAISLGAKTIVFENDAFKLNNVDITWLKVNNSNQTLGNIACNYYEHPSYKLKVIAVTGTNGKTTIATLLYQVLLELGEKVGLLSTINNFIIDEKLTTTHTTPNAVEINSLLYSMVEKNCRWAVMEVSSHALAQYRTEGLHFTGAIFSNLSRDHLDYHLDYKSYTYTKKKLFDHLSKDSFALVNKDDKQCNLMTQNTEAKVYTYGIKRFGDYQAQIIENTFEGLELQINGIRSWFRLIGEFNAYNLLAVFSTFDLLGMDTHQVILILSRLKGVEGRFENIMSENGKIGIIDYCHTPAALESVLKTLNKLSSKEKIITVFGCGGNRDRGKRPLMTNIAVAYSRQIIVTSDNPRNESPSDIISDMLTKMKTENKEDVLVIENREEAIKTAVTLSQPDDIILVSGKGHEDFQEIRGEKLPFNDKKILEKYLKA